MIKLFKQYSNHVSDIGNCGIGSKCGFIGSVETCLNYKKSIKNNKSSKNEKTREKVSIQEEMLTFFALGIFECGCI